MYDCNAPYRKKKRRHNNSSLKNFVTGKIIRHFLPTNFLPGYLKTLIELKKHLLPLSLIILLSFKSFK